MSSCRISHFGINPVSGGSPPRERRERAAVAVRMGTFDQLVASILIFVAEVILNVRKIAVVIKM